MYGVCLRVGVEIKSILFKHIAVVTAKQILEYLQQQMWQYEKLSSSLTNKLCSTNSLGLKAESIVYFITN